MKWITLLFLASGMLACSTTSEVHRIDSTIDQSSKTNGHIRAEDTHPNFDLRIQLINEVKQTLESSQKNLGK